MEQRQEERKEGSTPVATDRHHQHHHSSSDQHHHQNHSYQDLEEAGVVSSVTNTCPTPATTTPTTPDLPTTSTTATTLAMDEEAMEEQEALEASPPSQADELEEGDGVEADAVVSSTNMKVGSQGRERQQERDECDGTAGGMFYYYCPLPLRAPWRNMYRSKKCVVYGVVLAGLCCLVLVLSVVIWRVSTGAGGVERGNVNNGEITLEEQGKYLKQSNEKGTLEDVPHTPTLGTGPLVAATDSMDYRGAEPHTEVKRFIANGSDFFKILHTDTISDSIIVGAKNMVYNISLTKSRELKVNKRIEWKSEDHIVRICRSRRKSAEDCQNYIRLVVNQTTSDLMVCGTNAFKPECRVYRSIPGTYELIDNASGVAICPYDPHQNNTYTHADGSLYTATIADANGRDSLIYRNPTRTVQHDSQMLNDPDFVSSFEYEDNVYFFFREFAVEYINCGKAIYSRVGRVCKKDRGGGIILRDIWTSFFKVRLNCSIPGDFPFYFDEIQSTTILGSGHFKPTMDPANRTDMIYAVFNTPENSISGSAVCAFLMSDVIAAFEGGFKEQKSVYSTWLAVNRQDTPKPHPAMCVNDSKELPIQTVNFIKSHPLMDRAVAAQGNRPILVQTSITSRMTQIAVDWQRQAVDGKAYDVLFIGKNDGTVLKAINRGTGSKIDTVIIEEIRVFSSGQAVTGLQVYRSQKDGQELIEHLVVVSRSEIKTIPLHRCGQQATCRSCVALRDPYCSWDQNRCRANTLHGEQNIDKGTGCLDEKTPPGENVIASSSSASAPTSTPCVCPEQRVVVHPTVDSQRGTSTTTENKDANRVVDPADTARTDGNNIPNVGLQRKDPEVGASTQVRGDTVSASTLAISLVFSILIALIVGFVAGYRTSVYRHKEGQDDFFSMRSPKAEGLKNLNRFDSDSNRYNTHDYLPQPRTEKQLNVVFNPLKPNSKLPNGSAQTEVQKQKAKKVYL